MGIAMGRSSLAGALVVVGAIASGWAPAPAHACGGFFCNGGGPSGPTPVVQAAERVVFEQRSDGRVRAYVQIQYQGAPVGFSWIIPVTAVPEVGVAEAAFFDELDAATSPQFRFVSGSTVLSSGGSGGGCGDSADRSTAAPSFGGGDGTMEVDEVHVWGSSRVGDYETATISGDSAEALRTWLTANGYDIPEAAEATIADYVAEGHLFVAFRYEPLSEATGTLQPIVLTYTGGNPCVPIRITAIASNPVLDVMILAFGARRAAPASAYAVTEPDYQAIRPDTTMGTLTTYGTEVLRSITLAGGRAFITEFAGESSALAGVTNVEARALIARAPYVTRFYTRLTPEVMTVDPEFEFPGGPDVGRLHVIDLTPPTSRADTRSELRYATAPAVLGVAAFALGWRKRRARGRPARSTS